MPSAPQRRQLRRPPPVVAKPPERRESAGKRGYGWAWTQLSEQERKSRVFCALCYEAFGIETPCGSRITLPSGRKKSEGVLDHIIPVSNDQDTLFWEEKNWWLLCDLPIKDGNGGTMPSCNSWKSLTFDGTYAKAKVHATDRTIAGVMRRRREIVEAMRKSAASLPAT